MPVSDTTRSLLPVAGGKLVSDLRRLDGADADLAELVALLVDGHLDLVDDTVLGASHEYRRVALLKPLCLTLQLQTERQTLDLNAFWAIVLKESLSKGCFYVVVYRCAPWHKENTHIKS